MPCSLLFACSGSTHRRGLRCGNFFLGLAEQQSPFRRNYAKPRSIRSRRSCGVMSPGVELGSALRRVSPAIPRHRENRYARRMPAISFAAIRFALRASGTLPVAALLLAGAVLLVPAAPALAQTYPSKPIRLVVPFAAGGAVDVLARLLANKLTESIGQAMLVENRPGAGGNIAADAVAKAPPDGYTILQNTNGQAISPSLYRNLPFDPVKDFAPVTQLVASNLVLVASPKSEIGSLAQLIALAKAKPGGLSYGSSGIG